MPDLSPYAITLGGTDYPSKYANLLGFLDTFLSPVAGLNKIINGRMDIAQRGTSFPAIATNTYSLDRYLWTNSSAAVATISQQADAPNDNEFQNSLRIAITTADTSIAAGDFANIRQRIEGFNVRDLIGKSFTLSFRVRSSKTGTHCVAFLNDAGDRSYVAEYTVSAANTWESKTVTVSGGLITAGTWNWASGTGLQVIWALAAGSSLQTTAGAWQIGTFIATANQVNCLDSNTNIFAVTGVDLKLGSVATAFEHRPIGIELDLCRRYYRQFTDNFVGYAPSAGVFGGRHTPIAPPMRATPTVTNNGVTGTNVGAYNTLAVNATEFNIQVNAAAAGQWQAQSTITLASEL